MSYMDASIRFAQEKDVPTILSLIKKKAEFDRGMSAFVGKVEADEEKISQTLFCLQPFAAVLLAEFAGEAVGFALFYYRYSSFKGQPSIWLDDLFVNSEARKQGVGTALLKRLGALGRHYDCSHIAWNASANNREAVGFYRKFGAEVVDQKSAVLTFQVASEVFEKWNSN